MTPKWFKRWRHRKGYGVHSPYAFRFVKDVIALNRSYGHYAYAEVCRDLRRQRSNMSIKSALLLFRVVVELQPSTICIVADREAEILRRIAKQACPKASIVQGDADLLICFSHSYVRLAAKHAIFSDRQCTSAQATIEQMAFGHVYCNRRGCIIVAHEHLPLQTFDIKF